MTGGQFIDGEFYYTKKKERAPLSRESQILGVFGDGSDDEGGGRRGLGGGRGGKRGEAKSSNLLVGMNFVSASTGILPAENRESALAGARPASTSSSSSASASEPESKFARNLKQKQEEKAKAAEGRAGLGSGGGAGAAAAKPRPPRAKMDASFGEFEKHTTGFGSKILAKYGFKGRLGKDESGVVNPIIPQVRPQGVGLGMIKEVNETERRNRKDMAWKYRDPNAPPEPGSDEDSDEEGVRKKKVGQAAAPAAAKKYNWKKDKKKVKTVYRDASQIVGAQGVLEADAAAAAADAKAAAASAPTSTPGATLIWDFTKGATPRITTLDQIATKAEPKSEGTPLLVLSSLLFFFANGCVRGCRVDSHRPRLVSA